MELLPLSAVVGYASATIDGVSYSAGTEDNPQNSKNCTENVNLTINGGTLNSPSLNYGLVYGGGEGYAYVGTVKMTIKGGDLSKSYVTAGGSNGYTKSSTVQINGGAIGIYQSVNRGTIDSVKLTVNGGNIKNLYIGGETGDAGVTGTVNQVKAYLLNGNIETLEPGKSNSKILEIDNKAYSVLKTNRVNIVNDNITSGEITINYDDIIAFALFVLFLIIVGIIAIII